VASNDTHGSFNVTCTVRGSITSTLWIGSNTNVVSSGDRAGYAPR
jgi:hypothetical protein